MKPVSRCMSDRIRHQRRAGEDGFDLMVPTALPELPLGDAALLTAPVADLSDVLVQTVRTRPAGRAGPPVRAIYVP
jgi:hypothetical protein